MCTRKGWNTKRRNKPALPVFLEFYASTCECREGEEEFDNEEIERKENSFSNRLMGIRNSDPQAIPVKKVNDKKTIKNMDCE